ncbi:lectin BRA-3-like [Mercenaria mercenaria]|uniref:lectin BRA-3-like n=1 Tax=Mercenaria mercenaria TaxID=6596 RepID=UPI001E1DE670|nr:lectin BRA-3-like [Mercenaria mercenaria]
MCRLHPCSDWSDWSNCDANRPGEFGGQNRSRNCGLNTTYCERHNIPSLEYDTRVCEGKCPSHYVVTKHGFCLKLYNNDKKQRDDAETACQTDGGHLVNTDSIIKVQDVNETILDQKYSGDRLWIDGRRSEQAGPWKYGYPSAEPSFTFWGDNDPDNGVNDLCIMYHKGSHTGNSWRWFDYDCGSKHEFICEIQ